jgi:Tol biopolymer transport system component
MTDERLRRSLRVVDGAPVRPDSAFVDDLHARLAAQLGLVSGRSPDRVPRPQLALRRGRIGWLAVAVLLVLAIVGLLMSQGGRVPDQSPVPSSQSPSSLPSGTPAPTTATAAPGAASPAPSLDALRGDGLVVFELGDLTQIPRLRVLNRDLSSAELLPDVPGVQGRASWHPDGTRLAFTAYDPSEPEAIPRNWETDSQGSEPRLLSERCDPPACIAENEPAYSPDGTRLVFVRTRTSEPDASPTSVVAVRDLETGVVTELESTSRPRDVQENLHPRWSPDGRTIAYAVATFDEFGFASGSVIRLVESNGTNDRALSAPELEAGDPAWSPDGSSILFSSHPIRAYAAQGKRESERLHLYTMLADGSGVRQYDLVGAVGTPSWTSTGEQILFTYLEGAGDISPGHARLFVMDPDGSNVLPLTSTLGTPAWYAVQQPRP